MAKNKPIRRGAISRGLSLSIAGARALNEDALIDSLRALLDQYEPLLVVARAEQNERLMDRMRREEQEEAYLA